MTKEFIIEVWLCSNIKPPLLNAVATVSFYGTVSMSENLKFPIANRMENALKAFKII